ncbi:MAG: arylsulfatase, partial [Planctomycetes bacterium]|nr:arylsulfatase [Planctomycetota bacterium]
MNKRNIRVIGRRDFLKGVSLTTAGLVLGARPGLAKTGGGKRGPKSGSGSGPKVSAKASGGGRGNRPNVILVMTDDQGYGEIGAHGNDVIVTPNLDRLHNISMRLTNFHVNPNCAPTRAALLTGRYAYKTGVTSTLGTRAMLRNDEVTMGDVFRDNGYKTAMFAKWHLGDNYPLRPQDRGFDYVVRHKGGGVSQTPDYWGNDRFDDTYFRNGAPEKFEGFSTDIFFGEAMKFIERNKNKPFFIYLPTSAAHSPMNAPQKYLKLYEGKGVNEKHYGMITCVDDNIGKLRACLRRYGLESNTILIFMTDNGSPGKDDVFSAGLRGGKGEKYDGAHRVPFFIYWPDGSLAQGTSSNRLSAHFDVLPTLIGLCGLTGPKGVRMDGVDLSGLIRGRDAGPLDRKVMLSRLVMTDRWRLILGKGGDNELYDMQNDRSQRHNVIDRHAGVAKELAAVYKRWDEELQLQSKSSDHARIHIGSDEENPIRLMAQDWHNATGKIPWNPPRIVNGEKCNGQWLVRVTAAGRYRFELRRWPSERPGPLQFGRQARLKIGGREWTRDFDAER